eukprot:gnl/TRDRNA2_/TRDRNA2_166910_c3_seq6.p1 gnl/TRDRNA2_/TRDRNA2_166910_c3~~gnl/TRDRNA2_/TRDRNA2_166910_c3_seq6.p1  ORF type:complete len:356 (-),score=49.62 gnl/TRDRNA2_/TRDRNA2_166910_c3_seq6:266-1189(-)
MVENEDLSVLMERGMLEHWLIKPEQLRVVDTYTSPHGGFGEVNRGVLLGSTDVALKAALRVDGSDKAASRTKALLQEIRLLRRIRHPNVVLFHGATTLRTGDVSRLFIVLEWVDGGNFEQFLRGQHDWHFAQKLILDIVRAMIYLHGQTPVILHRDLKPANILVEKAEPPKAKVTDFGLSVLLEEGKDAVRRVGTKSYMAPEVVQGKPYNTAADVYSFGCVMFFALAAEHPRDNTTMLASIQAHKSATSDEKKVLRMCIDVDPLARPSFAKIYDDLSTASGESTATPSSSFASPEVSGHAQSGKIIL